MKISKTHEAYIKIKDALNKNKYKDYTVTDDIQVLKIANDFNLEIDTLLYSYEEDYHTDTLELLNSLKQKALNVYEISNSSYEAISLKENHAGIIALIKLNKYSFDDFKNKDFLIVLDKLEIPGNIGTIYRTADSINASGIILVDPVSKINNPKITSSSRGCNLIIPTISASFTDTLKYLLDNDYDIYLGEPILGKPYDEYDYKGKVAIVVGNERFGINQAWYENKSKNVYIPMEGNQNSLNVSIAASILAYEAYMKRKKS